MRPDPRWRAVTATAILGLWAALAAASPAPAADSAIGTYRAADGPDTASMLELRADGQFRYGLSEGALDEHAEGRWQRDGAVIRLTTQPRPNPPVFAVESMTAARTNDAPLSIFVNGPSGQGVAGVYFRIDVDRGDPVEDYTQEYGWSGDIPAGQSPVTIRLDERIFGIVSPPFAIPAGSRTLRFVLHPNDIGVADFQGTQLAVDGDRLTLAHRLGDRHYVRVKGGR